MDGIVRKLDYMRRLIIPKEMTDILRLKPCDLVEITLDEDKICIRPYSSDSETYNFIRNFIISNFETKDFNSKIDEQAIINITGKLKEIVKDEVIYKDM